MKKKAIFIPLTGILIAVLLTFAGCKRHAHHKGAEFMVDYVGEVLDLTDDQKADLDQIKAEFTEKVAQMHADHDAVKAEILVQLEKDEMDAAELKQLAAQHRAKMEELIDQGIDRLVAFHKTLSPEQKAKLVNKLEDFDRWHRH